VSKPVIQIFPTGSGGASPSGLSYWNQFQSGCPHQRKLDKECEDALKALQIVTEDDEAAAVDIGAAFHKILEHYYGGTFDTVAFDSTNPAVGEALRLFAGYRERFPREEFGKVVGCEVDFAFLESDNYSPVGVRPFTGRIDMVVEVGVENLPALNDFSKRNLGLPKGGVYLMDTKTMGARRRNLEIEYQNSLQFHAYQMCWNTLHADTPALGMIVNGVVRHKRLTDSSFFSVFVPPPTPAQQEAVRQHLQLAQRLRDAMGEDYKNRNYCFSWGRVCPHFQTGACDRS